MSGERSPINAELELCRDLLRALDTQPEGQHFDPTARFGDASEQQVREQLRALLDAGLVRSDAGDVEPSARISGLSHSGREFLRLARNDTLWQRVRAELASGDMPISLDMVRARLLEWGQFSF